MLVGQGLARGRRVRMVPLRNEAEASARGAETNRGQTTTASSIGGTVNVAHKQGGQTTSRDGSTAVEGIEEEKEERGVSAQSVSPADSYRGDQAELGTESVPELDSAIASTKDDSVPTADCAPKAECVWESLAGFLGRNRVLPTRRLCSHIARRFGIRGTTGLPSRRWRQRRWW